VLVACCFFPMLNIEIAYRGAVPAFIVGNWHLAKITACPLRCHQPAGGYLVEVVHSRSGIVGKHLPDRSTYRCGAHRLRCIIHLSKIPAGGIGFRL